MAERCDEIENSVGRQFPQKCCFVDAKPELKTCRYPIKLDAVSDGDQCPKIDEMHFGKVYVLCHDHPLAAIAVIRDVQPH